MRTNLETFPKVTDREKELMNAIEWADKGMLMLAWKEDFEAELREIIAGRIQPEYAFAKGMCKEILGE